MNAFAPALPRRVNPFCNGRNHIAFITQQLSSGASATQERAVDSGGAVFGLGGLARPEKRRGGRGELLPRAVVAGQNEAVAAPGEGVGGPVDEF